MAAAARPYWTGFLKLLLVTIAVQTTDTIDIAEFVDAGGLDAAYVGNPYYLVPDGSIAEEGYRVIREA